MRRMQLSASWGGGSALQPNAGTPCERASATGKTDGSAATTKAGLSAGAASRGASGESCGAEQYRHSDAPRFGALCDGAPFRQQACADACAAPCTRLLAARAGCAQTQSRWATNASTRSGTSRRRRERIT